MARVENAPERICPECSIVLQYTSSIAADGGFYDGMGDNSETAAMQHHYECRSCKRCYFVGRTGQLTRVGAPSDARRTGTRNR